MNRYRHIFTVLILFVVIGLSGCAQVASPKMKGNSIWDIFSGARFHNKMRTEVTTEDNSQGKVTINTAPAQQSHAYSWFLVIISGGVGLFIGWVVPTPQVMLRWFKRKLR